MIRKKYRILAVGLAFLLAIICGAYFPNMPAVFAGEEAVETLTIKGDGVNREITYSRHELERMAEARERFVYSATNNFPTEKLFYREGVSLDYLLKQAGIKDSAKQLKFISSDGYTRTFTRKELLEDLRYSFDEKGIKTQVSPTIAYSDSSKGFSSLSPIELCLTMGQRAVGEQNNPWFVKYLKTIEVSTAEPERWEEVTFKKTPGPDGVTITPVHPRMDSVKIYYSLDGTNPTVHSRVYNISATYYQPQLNKPILVTKDAEVRAIAIGAGKNDSPVSTTTVTFGNTRFTDLTDYSWARLAIESLAEQGIINGMGGSRFAPEQTLTRAQFATMMVLALGDKPSNEGTVPFNDVKAGDWYFGYVKKAATLGLINGYTDGTFRPDAKLSREEMITIAVKAAGMAELSAEKTEEILKKFSGQSRISSWARAHVALAEDIGILEHGHMVIDSAQGAILDAQKAAARAEAAVTVYKLLDNINKNES
ncbi:MAG: hypothetical protein GXX92_01195 [Clostridiales bacterium]|nr:hypothetical protein [Clostridiales bacterium]